MKKFKKRMKRAASGLAVIAAAGLCASGLGMPQAVAEPLMKRFVENSSTGPQTSQTIELTAGAARQPSRPAQNQYQPAAVPPPPSGQQPQSNAQQSRPAASPGSNNELEHNEPGPVRAALTGFVDRVGRVFRRDPASSRNAPPEDPGGFSYPTASNPNLGRNPRSMGATPPATGNIGDADIPSIPPAANMGPPRVPGVATSKAQPGLFQPPATAAHIADGTPSSGLPLADIPIPPLDSLGLPIANDIMPAPIAPAPIADSAGSLPNVTDDSGIPSIPPLVTAELDSSVPAAPSASVAALPSEPSTPTASRDPFANLFPADREKPQPIATQERAASTGEPLAMPAPGGNSESGQVAQETAEEPPFTGVALEPDLIEQAQPLPLPKATIPQAVTESSDPVASVPSLDLSLPADMPKLPPVPSPTVTQDTAPAEFPAVATTPAESVGEAESVESTTAPQPLPMTPEVKPAPLEVPVTTEPKPVPKGLPQTDRAEEPVVEKPASRPRSEHQSKMERIAARRGQTGFKGFCPVVLRDERELVDGHEDFVAEYEGREYKLSSKAAKEIFLNEPERYAPAAQGYDVIHQSLTGEKVDGLLDYAVWYRDCLYLFSTVETMETFVAAPSSHAIE